MTAGAHAGQLRDEPLPELLGAMLREQATAVLRLQLPSGPAEIYFIDGRIVAVELPGNVDRLGELLVASGALDGETLGRTVTAPRPPGQRYGTWLVEAGLLQSQHLQAALRLQVRRRLHRLFFADGGVFSIERGMHGRGEGPERALVDPRRPVMQGVRSAWSEPRYGMRLPASRLRLSATAEDLGEYGLPAAELALLEPLRTASQTVGELVTSSVAGPASTAAAVRPIVYALFATSALTAERTHRSMPAIPAMDGSVPARTAAPAPAHTPAERSGPAAGEAGPAVRPRPAGMHAPAMNTVPLQGTPAPSAAPDQAIAQAIVAKRSVVDGQDFFAVLGVTRDSSREEVKAAYLEAARLYHPDRLAAIGLSLLRSEAEHVFRKASEAHLTLSDEVRRAEYVARLDAPEVNAEQAEAQRILAAEVALFEGDVALKRRDYRAAIERLQDAVRLNSNEGEALALLAWARVSGGVATLVELRTDFEQAVVKSPRCARAHYFLGMARKQGRETQSAINSFRKAVELDPRMAEAVSELRVLQLRATRELPTMSRGTSSFLDRLRKK